MLYQQIARNKRKTALIMFIFLVILGLVGAGIGYLWSNSPTMGVIIALIGSLVYLFIMWQNPANMIMSLNHAQEIHEADNPELWHIVEDMAMVAQVPMPRVYIIPDPSPNAFATGRDPEHSAVAVTQGILELLDREELEGVLGHELSHVKNYDILLSTISALCPRLFHCRPPQSRQDPPHTLHAGQGSAGRRGLVPDRSGLPS